MQFCCKFYGIEFLVVLFGLLLSLSVLNGVESDCNYFQSLTAGQTYYVYNPEYPNGYKGEKHCTWEMASPYNTKISCTLEMGNNCYQERLSVQFADGSEYNYCGYNTFVLNGINPTIKFDSAPYNLGGRFLCEIQTISNYCNCGWKKVTRIVGGEETGVNEYPMMCGLVDSTNIMIYCGGTIISEQYILTAAHCIEKRDYNKIGVIVGEHDTTRGSDTNATMLFRLVGCIIYPLRYKNMNEDAYNDIAVCKIAGKIKYSAEVGPACLPFQHKQDSFAGNKVTALGWGLLEFAGKKSTTLQKVDLNVIPIGECKRSYPKVNDSNICTFTRGKDTCQMDSGGPLLWQDPKTHNLVLVGITSSGEGCASDSPAVAMRTGAFIDWIKSVTPDAQYCQVE